jgi:hypothetical protein
MSEQAGRRLNRILAAAGMLAKHGHQQERYLLQRDASNCTGQEAESSVSGTVSYHWPGVLCGLRVHKHDILF